MLDISLRIANLDDMQTVLELRNQPSNYRYSGAQVDSKEHIFWFRNRLNSIISEPFWMICINDKTVGYVRFDKVNEEIAILRASIAIDKTYQGLGIGKRALEISISNIKLFKSKITIQAKIHIENKSSISIFKSAGFVCTEQIDSFYSIYEKKF